MDKNDKQYCVYFIKVKAGKNTPTKIGYTSDVGRRLLEIQTCNPNTVKLDCTIPCDSKERAQKLERFLHRQLYHRCHISGEWYNLHNVHLAPILHKFYGSHKQMFPDSEPLKLYSGNILKYSKVLSENGKLKAKILRLESELGFRCNTEILRLQNEIEDLKDRIAEFEDCDQIGREF